MLVGAQLPASDRDDDSPLLLPARFNKSAR